MRKSLVGFAVVALVGFAADLALGHGGSYAGPQGGGTPQFGGPAGGSSGGGQGGPTGGGNGNGGTTPGQGGGGGGTTPPGGAGPPRPGTGAGGGPGGARGGATPGGGKPKAKDDRTHDWDWWWELNDDQYLKVKAAIRSKTNMSDESDRILGNSDGAKVSKVTQTQIRNDVLPIVRAALNDPFFDARAGAAIALGKIVDMSNPDLEGIKNDLRKLLSDSDKVVRESACIGLGLLGDKSEVAELIQVYKNSPEARKVVSGNKDILPRQRAFAAIAIGLIGLQEKDGIEPGIVAQLLESAKKDEAHADLQVFPALALGIMHSDKAVPELEALVKNVETDEIVRAHSIVALAKLGDKGFVNWFAKNGLTDKSNHVQRSSAIALGLLTDKEDDKTVEILMQQAGSAADRATKNFALIALGQIGGMKARDFLVTRVKKGQPHDRTFAALALGVYGNRWNDSKDELGAILLEQWKDDKSDSNRGAYAIGLGLLDYKKAVTALMDEMKTGGSPELKGHTATALGLLGAKEAIPVIQERAKQSSDLDAQRRASIALGLIGDPEAVNVLLKVIEESSSNLSALGGAAVALGFIGDKAAVAPLGNMLAKREQYKDNARAFAAVALGILADKSELPLLSKVQENCNYLATTEGLTEILLIY